MAEKNFVDLNGWEEFETPGTVIEGEYLGYTEIVLNDRKVPQFMVLTESGIVSFNGTVQLLRLKVVPAGTYVRIAHTGVDNSTKNKGNAIKLFKIGILEEEFNAFRNAVKESGMKALPPASIVEADPEVDPFAEQ